MSADDAMALMRRFVPEHAATLRYERRLTDSDQWTLQNVIRNNMPIHRIALDDEAGTEYYVSEKTGEPVLRTTSHGRVWGYLGAVLHWLYFTPLRRHGAFWNSFVVWSSLIGTLVCVMGIVIGIWRYSLSGRFRLRGARSHTPYATWMKWHHYTGLIFGFFAAMWAFSGALSLGPFDSLRASPPSRAFREAATGGPITLEPLTIERIRAVAAQVQQSFTPKELDFFQFQGEPYFIAYVPPSPSESAPWRNSDIAAATNLHIDRKYVLVSALRPEAGPFTTFDKERMWDVAKRAMPGIRMEDAAWLNEYDAYYYSQDGRRPLPVLRIRYLDAPRTWLYLDPARGAIASRLERGSRWNRWLYHGFHSLDFPFMYYKRPLWDIVVIVLSIGGIALSITSGLPAWRRLVRHGKHAADRWMARGRRGRRQGKGLSQSRGKTDTALPPLPFPFSPCPTLRLIPRMRELEQLLALFVAAVLLASAARRVGAPYPVFLALGGALLAFVPGAPSFTVPPELALALFVAPVLLDAAFDASPRDLRDNWAPVTGLVVFAVGLTTAAVAIVVCMLVPDMPWGPAIVLGAVVAPPDAAAATAVLRPLRPPHRLLTILEGESLLNDASALLIYRLAVGAVAAGGFSLAAVAPAFLLAVAGSVVVGPALGWLLIRLMARVQHVPTAIILQFVSTFAVWMLAEHIGLSAVLTMVCYAITVARTAPERIPARTRIPTYAVWETAVFALNILAFIFIGLQIRPILDSLEAADRGRYFAVAGAVLLTVVVVRVTWHMAFNAVVRKRHRRRGFHPPRPMLRPTVGSGLVISWAGMRGIVSLAAALALPPAFPYRDLIVLTAFAVVVGTLAIQGLTLKPLLRALDLHDDDPIGREVRAARERALGAGLASFAHDNSRVAAAVRQEFTTHLTSEGAGAGASDTTRAAHNDIHRGALQAAREAVLAMRANDEIGDDAFHRIEEELDWLEMADGPTQE